MTRPVETSTDEQTTDNHFETMGLSPVILRALADMGYEEPTPIQRECIPLVMSGHDVMGLAQTGTGKTAAFGLPLVQQLLGEGSKPFPKTIRALILSPTRELANQIADNLREFVRNTHLRVVTVVGGSSINIQQRNLGKGNDILVATPGRLLDLVDRKAVMLDSAKYLVLDEADQMLDLGFIHDLKKISKMVARQRQTLLFSATMPPEIASLAQAFLQDPVRIEVAPPGKAADKVRQVVHFVPQRAKLDMLKACLAERPNDLSLVFARTKHGAEKIKKILVAEGFSASSIHGNKSQGQRDKAIKDFRAGDIRILVATDVAARGIDIPGVSHVYNYDLPDVAQNYVHRIGRTARAGAGGEAVAFCSAEEAHLLKAIEKVMGMKVEIASGTMSAQEAAAGAKAVKEAAKASMANRGKRRGQGQGQGNGQSRGQTSGRGRGKSITAVVDGPAIGEGEERPASARNRRPRNASANKQNGGSPNLGVPNSGRPNLSRPKGDATAGEPGARPQRSANRHGLPARGSNVAANNDVSASDFSEANPSHGKRRMNANGQPAGGKFRGRKKSRART